MEGNEKRVSVNYDHLTEGVMNIDDFIISSKILLEKGQFESALCLICCAIDACANSKYRNIKG